MCFKCNIIALLPSMIPTLCINSDTMVNQSKLRRSATRSSGMDHSKAYETALSHELSELVYVSPRMQKFLELKGVQYRVR